MGPQSLQIKLNTRSFKMSALNSFQLFPLRTSPSIRGKHVARPQREGRGARGVGAGGPLPRPRPLLKLAASGGLRGRRGRASYLGRHILPFVWLGERLCLCCLRVWGGNFCAPTGDIVCLLLPGAAAPPSPARALGCSFFSPGCIQTGSGCSALTFAEDWVSACRKPPAAILVKAADAAWLRVHHLGQGSRYPAAPVAHRWFWGGGRCPVCCPRMTGEN